MKTKMISLATGRLRRTWALLPLLALACGAWAQTKVANESELKTALSNGGKASYASSSYLPGAIQNAKASRDYNGIIMLTSDIVLESTLAIENGNDYTIDLNGHKLSHRVVKLEHQYITETPYGRVLEVRKGGKLTLKDGCGGALIADGFCKDDGGAILNNGTLTIEGISFSNNRTTGNGGAIANNGTLTIKGLTLNGNRASGNGGAIANNGTLTLGGGVVMQTNKATDKGGAIANLGKMTINGVTIQSNEANGDGSGIWNEGSLDMQGRVIVKGNSKDDLYLSNGKKIRCTGAFDTSSRIGIHTKIKSTPEVFTDGYPANNENNNHFFLNEDPKYPYHLTYDEKGEVGIVTEDMYYECSWDAEKKQVEYKQVVIPDGVAIDNICSAKYSHGGDLWGDNYWFIAKGKATIPNGLTCEGKDVHIILYDGAEVTVEGGLKVKPNTHLHIYSQSYGENMGHLIAKGSDEDAAAIGGNEDYISGNITIHGGFIEATAESDCAGIGGGNEDESGFKDIVIYGGIIVATGGNYAAGIGCGDDNDNYGTVTVYGGFVEATGGFRGAGIGGGEDCHGCDVNIYGGFVKAVSSMSAAAIGGSKENEGGKLEIHGGTVIASVPYEETSTGLKIAGTITTIIPCSLVGLWGGSFAGPVGLVVGPAIGAVVGAIASYRFFWEDSEVHKVLDDGCIVGDDMVLYTIDVNKTFKKQNLHNINEICKNNNLIIITGKDVPVESLNVVNTTKANSFDFEEETTGIDESLTSHPSPLTSEYFTFDGKCMEGQPTQKGTYIVKYTDGTTRKVSIK